VVCQRVRLGPSGPGAQRPVILPPLEAGGIRCSVKQASRNARRSRCRDAKAFAKAPAAHYATWNGRRMCFSSFSFTKNNGNNTRYVKKVGRKKLGEGQSNQQEKSDTEPSVLLPFPVEEKRDSCLGIPTLAGPISKQTKDKVKRCNKKPAHPFLRTTCTWKCSLFAPRISFLCPRPVNLSLRMLPSFAQRKECFNSCFV